MKTVDLKTSSIREINQSLHNEKEETNVSEWTILNPKGTHNIACGLDANINVRIQGDVGYFCAGMNQKSHIFIHGNAGQGVAENMMSGVVRVSGDASQSAGATAHGGLLVIDGNAGARCGISLKGADIIVKGDVGHMSCFMGQAGSLVVCGNAGEALGDSLYEVDIFVKGNVKSLGADCVEKDMNVDRKKKLSQLLELANVDENIDNFKYYGSARELYNFKVDNVSAY